MKKFLVIGCGSIGRRHLRNLKTLGIENLSAFDPSAGNLATAREETGAEIFDNLDVALSEDIDVCFICSPSSLHIEQAMAAARKGCHLFIEKPLSDKLENFDELEKIIGEKNLITLVGCNMRFHPGPAKVKELLEENAIGKVLSADVYTGSYLPEWRPATDYRKSYSGIKKLGGGVILDCIHEIDLAYWYSSKVDEVFCFAETLSLDIETEDVAFLILKHANGILSEVHLDYIQRTYERGCKIIGENGSIFWDFIKKEVRLYQADVKDWKYFQQPESWEINQMYLDEIQHFIDCVENGNQTICSVKQAIDVTNIALAAKESVEVKMFISIT